MGEGLIHPEFLCKLQHVSTSHQRAWEAYFDRHMYRPCPICTREMKPNRVYRYVESHKSLVHLECFAVRRRLFNGSVLGLWRSGWKRLELEAMPSYMEITPLVIEAFKGEMEEGVIYFSKK